MPAPWNRKDFSKESMPPSERRRRRRERQTSVEDRRHRNVRTSQERDRQRLLITVGSTFILIILVVVAVGYYKEFYQPPRVMAGEIRGVKFTMGDLVQRIRVLQGIGRYDSGGYVDLSKVPFQILQEMMNAEILRQAAPGLGITITREDIDKYVKDQFAPKTPEGQETDPGQLESEFQNNYKIFLTATGLSDAEYRVIAEEQLLAAQLFFGLGANIEESQEQVEIEWISLNPEGGVQPVEVKKRLETENFADVALELGTPGGFADQEGYVGWVPKGAFPDLDAQLFGDDKTPALAVGALGEPVYAREGTRIVRKKAGPEVRELADRMRFQLNNEIVKKWQSDQLSRGSDDGWLKMNFNSDRYAWVTDQVLVSAPRVTPTPRPQNPLQGFRP